MRNALVGLTAAALVLPILIIVVGGVGQILLAMDDLRGCSVTRAIALGLSIAWIADIICLIILQAVHSLFRSESE